MAAGACDCLRGTVDEYGGVFTPHQRSLLAFAVALKHRAQGSINRYRCITGSADETPVYTLLTTLADGEAGAII